MIIQENAIFIKLEVDGAELPNSASVIADITMTEGNGALAPALEIILNDFSGHLQDSRALTDGNLMVLTVGKSVNDTKNVTRQYRLFGMKQIQSAAGPQIKAVASYDAPNYLIGSTTESFQGTTSDIFRTIAGRCKLKYSGPEDFNGRKMTDSQIWRNVCRSRAVFSSDASLHGHMDDTSAMCLMLTSLGILKYRNLMDIMEVPVSKIKRSFLHNIPPSESNACMINYSVKEAKDRSISGLVNTWQNYGSTRVEHSLSGKRVDHTKIGIKTKGTYLPINDQITKTVGRVRTEYAPLDCGNTSAGYQQAMYQNLKILGLFGESLSIFVHDITDVQLLDPVIYRQANTDISIPVKNSDVYIVVGKTVIITGAKHYGERIELIRMSLTKKGAAALKSADGEPASDIKSCTTPDLTINPTAQTAKTSLPTAVAAQQIAAPAATAMKSVAQQIPAFNNNIGHSLNNINQSIKTLTTTAAKLSSNAMQASAQALHSSMNLLGGAASTLSNSLVTAERAVATMANTLVTSALSPMAKQAMLFQPGGIFSTFAASTGALKQLTNISTMTNMLSTNYSLPALGVTQAVTSGLNAGSAAITASTQNATASQAKMWNSILRIISVSEIPVLNTSNAVALQKALAIAYSPSTHESSSVQSLDSHSTNVQSLMLKKDSQNQLPWQSEAPLPIPVVPITDAQKLADEIAADQAYAQKRNLELTPTSWK